MTRRDIIGAFFISFMLFQLLVPLAHAAGQGELGNLYELEDVSQKFQDVSEASGLDLIRDWRIVSLLAILLVSMIIAIAFAFGRAFNMQNLEAWAKVEASQAVVSLFIVVGIIAAFTLMDSIVVTAVKATLPPSNPLYGLDGCTASGDCTYKIAGFYMDGLISSLQTVEKSIIGDSVRAGERIRSFGFSTPFAFWPVPLLWASWGMTLNGDAQLAIERSNQIMMTSSALLSSLYAQEFFVQEIALKLGTYLLAIGIVARTFFFTRKLGGLLLAAGIGLLFVFPLTYVMDFETLKISMSTSSAEDAGNGGCPDECMINPPLWRVAFTCGSGPCSTKSPEVANFIKTVSPGVPENIDLLIYPDPALAGAQDKGEFAKAHYSAILDSGLYINMVGDGRLFSQAKVPEVMITSSEVMARAREVLEDRQKYTPTILQGMDDALPYFGGMSKTYNLKSYSGSKVGISGSCTPLMPVPGTPLILKNIVVSNPDNGRSAQFPAKCLSDTEEARKDIKCKYLKTKGWADAPYLKPDFIRGVGEYEGDQMSLECADCALKIEYDYYGKEVYISEAAGQALATPVLSGIIIDDTACPRTCRELPYPTVMECADSAVQYYCALLDRSCYTIRWPSSFSGDCPSDCKVVPALSASCGRMAMSADGKSIIEITAPSGGTIRCVSYDMKSGACTEERMTAELDLFRDFEDSCAGSAPNKRISRQDDLSWRPATEDSEFGDPSACQASADPLLSCVYLLPVAQMDGNGVIDEGCDSCVLSGKEQHFSPAIQRSCYSLCRGQTATAVVSPGDFSKMVQPFMFGDNNVVNVSSYFVPAYFLPLLNIIVVLMFIRTFSPMLGGDIEIPGLSKVF